MTIDPTTYTSGQPIIQRLESHNPWWDLDGEFDLVSDVDARRDAYIDSIQALVSEEASLYFLGGGSNKDTSHLLKQLIGTVLRPEFQEQYIRDADLRDRAKEYIVPAKNIVYLPLGATALYQIHPTEQLQAVVDHVRTHLADSAEQLYLFLEDYHQLRRPKRRGGDDDNHWLTPVVELLQEHPDLTIFATAPSNEFTHDQLSTNSALDSCYTNRSLRDVTHLGFAEFLRLRHRSLDVAQSQQRFNPDAVHAAFRTGVQKNTVEPLQETLQEEVSERILEPETLRRETTIFTIAGGLLTTRLARMGIVPDSKAFEKILRNRAEPSLPDIQEELVDEFRQDTLTAADQLYELKDTSGPERLAALIANNRPVDPVEFKTLSKILNVDRRTIREQHLRVLSELDFVGGTPAYANKRPRSIGLYHRDPSIVAALCGYNLRDALRQEPGLAEELWKTAVFDHTVRLSERLNHPVDPKRGVVKHWSADEGLVDFVMKIDGRPVPVVFTPDDTVANLERGPEAGSYTALLSFLRQTDSLADEGSLSKRGFVPVPDAVAEQREQTVEEEGYFGKRQQDVVVDGNAPFGIVVTNTRDATETGITVADRGPRPIIQIPLWTYLRLG